MKTKKPRSGFTLVELLVVIAIIGILAGLLFPAIGDALDQAKQTAASNSVGQIAKSHFGVAIASAKPKRVGDGASNTADWAADLAGKGGVNSGSLYFAGGITASGDAGTVVLTDVNNQTENSDFMSSTLAYSVVPNYPSVVSNAEMSALLWTVANLDGGVYTGTLSDGNPNPWGNAGMHVAYVDGHVEWYERLDLNDDPFYDRQSGGTSANPADSAPNNAEDPVPGG